MDKPQEFELHHAAQSIFTRCVEAVGQFAGGWLLAEPQRTLHARQARSGLIQRAGLGSTQTLRTGVFELLLMDAKPNVDSILPLPKQSL